MDQSKPIASLSPTLLARKGGAKPAMRPHHATANASAIHEIETDLGWDDHGQDDDGAEVVPIGRASEGPAAEVRRQQERLVRSYTAVPAQASSPRRSAFEQGRKAAFTLRMDEDRHLRLKLACAAGNRSAQQMVTEALDKLLSELPELDAIAGNMRRKRHS